MPLPSAYPATTGVARGSVEPVLEIEDLHVAIRRKHQTVRPIDGASLNVGAGELVGLVGESGCGKSMTALSVLGLLPAGGEIERGRIAVCGQDVTELKAAELRQVRGEKIGIVFQDPLSSLNPSMRIGDQVSEPARLYGGLSAKEARERAVEVLEQVKLARPRERLDNYPHQLSGGMRQRVMIAMALVCDPPLLIADEPTTALDVTIQAQILRLLDDLRERLGMGILLITHNMGVVAQRADRVAVMYAGRIVEVAPAAELFRAPRHHYAAGLLASIPTLEQDRTLPIPSIPGTPPDLATSFTGCRFAPRCLAVQADCRTTEPTLDLSPDHAWECLHPRADPSAEASP